jgi:RNA polymerase sigma factor (sigma-70 family)
MLLVQKQKNEFTDVFRQEQHKLIRYVQSRVSNISEMDAEDIVADVVFNVYNRVLADQPVENLIAYLYQAVKNKIKDYFRRPKPVLSLDEVDKTTGISKAERLLDENGNVEAELEQKEFILKFKAALLQLEPKQRAVWVATELDDYTFKELAEKWNEPIGTLLSRKSRAAKALRKALSDK